jgi:hypothetical protein
MGYRILFEASGIHHSNSGLQRTHIYIIVYFMLLFDAEAHTSLPENGKIRIEQQFCQALPELITCLLYF